MLNLVSRQLLPNLPQGCAAASAMPYSLSRLTAQFAAAVKRGRTRHPRAVDIRQIEEVVHDLGILESLFFDALNDRKVNFLLSGQDNGEQQK
jgi:hypothetical protein